MSNNRGLDKENVALIYSRHFQKHEEERNVCRRLVAVILDEPSVSEREMSCFLSFLDPRQYRDIEA